MRCVLGRENIAGARVPVVEEVVCEVADYALLARPAWVDILARRLQHSAELHIRLQVAAERQAVLQKAVRRVTQRVNLCEKVLIPRARGHIRRIQIFLGDLEREAVVRAKLAKAR